MSREQLHQMGVVLDDEPEVESYEIEGPWQSGFVMVMHTPVRSKSNFRRRQARGQRWSQIREFEATFRRAVTAARPEGWPEDSLEVPFAERHSVVGVCYARALLDTPNLGKSIYDAAEGVLYANDAQVRAETALVDRARGGSLLVCGFAAVETGEVLDLAEAHSQLAAATVSRVGEVLTLLDAEDTAEDTAEDGASDPDAT